MSPWYHIGFYSCCFISTILFLLAVHFFSRRAKAESLQERYHCEIMMTILFCFTAAAVAGLFIIKNSMPYEAGI